MMVDKNNTEKSIKINIITMFPEMFNYFQHGILSKNKSLKLNIYNLRDYGTPDDLCYGSSGMLLRAEPIAQCIDTNHLTNILYPSPRGELWNHKLVLEYEKMQEITILCGRYEGVDQRVIDHYHMKEISLGDYVISGGELAALIIIDSIGRYAGGVKVHSLNDSFTNGLLEHDNYTRPKVWRDSTVPCELLSGNHKMIHNWRRRSAINNTLKIRPNLMYEFIMFQILNTVSS